MGAAITNWGNLPSDLLHLIVTKLPDICDFIQTRAVCKTWRSAIPISDLVPQFPWILLCSPGWHSTLKFYSISSNKFYDITGPVSFGKNQYLFASMHAHQYACVDRFSLLGCERPHHEVDKRQISLFNPLNNNKACILVPDGFQFSSAWISGRSIQREEGYVVLSNRLHQLALCKPRNGNWDVIGEDSGYKFVFLKGMVITAYKTEDIRVARIFDIGSRKVVHILPLPVGIKYEGPFLIESSGEILCVSYTHQISTNRFKFCIHRLEFADGNKDPSWVKVRSIGDRILFFDFNEHRGFSRRAGDCPGFKGNCIYFIKCILYKKNKSGDLIVRYDLENDDHSFIHCPFDHRKFMWFIPSLN